VDLAFKKKLQKLLTWWDRYAARHLLPIILISFLLALALSTGIVRLIVTTTPVESWASPLSRSGVEKEFFVREFCPIYRTTQIIKSAI
jgi:hypothetical protein